MGTSNTAAMQGAAKHWDTAITKALAFLHRDESLGGRGEEGREGGGGTEGGRDGGTEGQGRERVISVGQNCNKTFTHDMGNS